MTFLCRLFKFNVQKSAATRMVSKVIVLLYLSMQTILYICQYISQLTVHLLFTADDVLTISPGIEDEPYILPLFKLNYPASHPCLYTLTIILAQGFRIECVYYVLKLL